MLKKRKNSVLIAGGAGFLGSYLCEAYLEKNWDVICVDNLYTGSKANINHLFSNSSFEFIRHDIVEPLNIEADLILNFACPASPVHYQSNPVKTLETSVVGTLNLLKLADKKNAKFFQASTSEVYGDPKEHPQPESYWGNVNPIGIRSCYDEGKRAGETLCFDFNRQYKTDIRVVRIFNTYGPRMDTNDGRVVSNFIIQALLNKDITVYGDGEKTRSFCYYSDLIEGIVNFADQTDFKGPINIGNDREYSINEFAHTILKLTGSKSKIAYLAPQQDDPQIRKPDLTLAKKYLGYKINVSLEEGLEKTIHYFRKVLS